MKYKNIIIVLLAALSLVACRMEEPDAGPCEVRLQLSAQDEVMVTRATDYSTLDGLDDFDADLFISNGSIVNGTTLSWNGSALSTNALHLEAGSYWFYGLMPKTDGASFNLANKTLSATGIPGLSTDNAMLIRIDEEEHTDHTLDIAQDQKNDTAYLKMDHLMAKVTPHFYINAAYNDLRTIKVKKVEFSIDNASKYTVSINYTNPVKPVVSWTSASTEKLSLTAFEYTSDAPALTPDKQAIGQFFLCPAQSVENLKMRVTYDVYDKKGALTRENVTAENAILKLKNESITAGTNYKLNIQVVPTYLYILSDNDEESVLIVE